MWFTNKIFMLVILDGNNDELKKKVIFKYLSSTVDWWVELIMTRRALTYNVSRKHNSQIKATLIWTVNDLLAYEMVSGWSIHRKLSCLYYMHHNKVFILFNSVKLFSYCYRGFCQVIINLEIIKKDFLKGKLEKDIASLVLLSE